LQFQSGVSVFSNTSGLGGVGNNVYSNPGTGDFYIATGFATRYYTFNGAHVWNTAASGTAGNAITFTQAMTLDASGRLGLGQTSIPSGVLFDLKEPTAGTDLIIGLSAGTGARAQIRSIAFGDANSSALSFHTTSSGSTAERARITAAGELCVGTTAAATTGPASGPRPASSSPATCGTVKKSGR
jgi:hypothetical protein